MMRSNRRHGQSVGQQFGISLIEVLMALAIATSMLVGLSSYMWDQTRSQQDVLLAQYHNIVTQAAQNYIQDNYSTISGGSLPATITVAQLISGGYLSSAVSSTNALGQTVCVKVVQPASGSLSAMVMGTGANTTYSRAAHIASLIGALGGAVDSTGAVKGAGGSWSIDYSTAATYGTCSSGVLSAGQFVSFLYFSNGSLVSDFLHRSYVGSLSANTMNVPLGLALESLGTGCSSNYVGFVGRDSTGQVLACVSNGSSYLWTALGGTWKSPVSDYNSLPMTGNSTGDCRITLDNGRTFEWNGSSWQALSVDQSGNLTVPSTLTAGAVAASGTITSASTVSGKTLISTLAATSGASCSGYSAGTLANNADGSGSVLSCQSSKWAKLGGGITGSYTNIGTGTGTYTGYNANSYAVMIMVSGGGGSSNAAQLFASVGSFGTVVSSSTNNMNYSKYVSITFAVPAYTSYTITSYPYASGAASFTITQFNLN